MRMRAFALACLIAAPASAQDGTLADLRQEIGVLATEVGRLKRELSTTGGADVTISGTSALERIDAMEAELRRLTGATEQMQNRIDRVVSDGSNRLGDLRFRVCEIDPDCDLSTLGPTEPLGGEDGAAPAPVAPAPVTDGAQLAIGEQEDFDRAREALDQGSFRGAADLFQAFTETYTGGPLTGQAHFFRGEALRELGDDAAAARAYLDAFSGQPTGPQASQALLALGLSLDRLGQGTDACLTLGEVPVRFPGSEAAAEAEAALARLNCQ